MKNIWKNHKTKIIALAYVIIAGILLYFVVLPLTKKIASKSDEIQSRILDREIENSRISLLSGMEENFQYSQDNEKAMEVLLSREEAVDFIKKMENIAQETGNSISFKVEETDKKKDAAKQAQARKEGAEKAIIDSLSYDDYIPIQIDLKGNYDGLLAFLNKLENTRNYINIISLESKVEKEKVSGSAGSIPGFGVFSPMRVENSGAKESETKERNVLHSTINVVVYTKK